MVSSRFLGVKDSEIEFWRGVLEFGLKMRRDE
jgi:hypothetical protein